LFICFLPIAKVRLIQGEEKARIKDRFDRFSDGKLKVIKKDAKAPSIKNRCFEGAIDSQCNPFPFGR